MSSSPWCSPFRTKVLLRTLIAGTLAGLVIVVGEAILNAWLLASQWELANAALGLRAPTPFVAAAALGKLFLLGFVLVWLYLALREKYGRGVRTGAVSGLVIALLLWVWAMSGLLMAGYVTGTIALVTMVWGLIELPLAAVVAVLVLERD